MRIRNWHTRKKILLPKDYRGETRINGDPKKSLSDCRVSKWIRREETTGDLRKKKDVLSLDPPTTCQVSVSNINKFQQMYKIKCNFMREWLICATEKKYSKTNIQPYIVIAYVFSCFACCLFSFFSLYCMCVFVFGRDIVMVIKTNNK